MAIKEHYDDGSYSVIYQGGDRVRIVGGENDWLTSKGDKATVCQDCPSIIASVHIRTDGMVEGDWGTHKVSPWDLEIVEDEDYTELGPKVQEYIAQWVIKKLKEAA